MSFGPELPGVSQQTSDALYSLSSVLIPAIIVMVFWIRVSSTPGKLVIRSVIVDADTGGEPTLKQWLIRYLGYYVASIPLCAGILWIHWDPLHQGWHDKLANTLVIRR